ncbi:hypothetical protein DC522_14480 [Microvirga sp. KLBC 81]|uniref:hypothetical protein n=1 Tax=Microvirga sp. KLBC 81 TaxID=1862707 RepID=UPI000D50C8B1|nr:hypothetical protein [Microvirga sp. KLBC 81]PVE23654.1 hypothetical protein DC522_14480 [Microvirga sp. KLBC 81]
MAERLYTKACGYTMQTEKLFCHEGEVIRAETLTYYPPDTTACIFWLKNRQPGKWRDKRVEEHELPEGSSFVVNMRSSRTADDGPEPEHRLPTYPTAPLS